MGSHSIALRHHILCRRPSLKCFALALAETHTRHKDSARQGWDPWARRSDSCAPCLGHGRGHGKVGRGEGGGGAGAACSVCTSGHVVRDKRAAPKATRKPEFGDFTAVRLEGGGPLAALSPLEKGDISGGAPSSLHIETPSKLTATLEAAGGCEARPAPETTLRGRRGRTAV